MLYTKSLDGDLIIPNFLTFACVFLLTFVDLKKKQSPFTKWIKGGTEKELPMFQNASFRKLKMYSSAEINMSQGLEKIRQQFWNFKGEELCSDKKLKKWKATALHGVIDTAWTLKKTPLLVLEANKLRDSAPQASETNKKRQKAGTLDENIQWTLTNHKALLNVNAELTALNDPQNTVQGKKAKIEKLEDAARAAIGDLKMAQESLRKAIQNGRSKAAKPYQVSDQIIKSTSEPTKEDIEGMLKAVLERTRSNTSFCESTDDSDE